MKKPCIEITAYILSSMVYGRGYLFIVVIFMGPRGVMSLGEVWRSLYGRAIFMGGVGPSRHRELHTINYMPLKSVKYMGAEYFSELEGKEGHIHGCKDNRFARNGFHQCFTIYPNWRKIYHQSSQKILKKLIRKICKIL